MNPLKVRDAGLDLHKYRHHAMNFDVARCSPPFFFTMTPILISLQWLLGKLRLPGWGFIASNYYRVLVRIVGIRVRVAGDMVRDRAVLLVSNHVSWADILVIGSIAPVAFIAKSEIAKWPLVGITAKLQRTVFVDRAARQQTGDAIAEIVKRLASGTSMVLFAEGTSSDGNHVLPFRSALIGAVKEAGARSESGILIQPMSICYTGDQRRAHGPPASPADRLVRRSRFHAAHQGAHERRGGRRGGYLRRAADRRRRNRPQGHGQDAGRHRTHADRRRLARPDAAGACRLPRQRLKIVTKSIIWMEATNRRPPG